MTVVWEKVGNIEGPRGDLGPASTVPGPPGPKGDKGDKGADSTVPGPKGDKGDKGDTGASGVWIGTQAQYDALPVKDPAVLYVIT